MVRKGLTLQLGLLHRLAESCFEPSLNTKRQAKEEETTHDDTMHRHVVLRRAPLGHRRSALSAVVANAMIEHPRAW